MTPPRDAMTPEAEKRLRVLEEHTELGAGYRIALHDLEMRGAGNLLGADQSGFIAAVGFETYLRLLEETIQKLKGEEERPAAEPELAFDADALPPDALRARFAAKLALYRRLSRLRDAAAIEDFRKELADRYGPLPEPRRAPGRRGPLQGPGRARGPGADPDPAARGAGRAPLAAGDRAASQRDPALGRGAGRGAPDPGARPVPAHARSRLYAALQEALESVVVAFEAAA